MVVASLSRNALLERPPGVAKQALTLGAHSLTAPEHDELKDRRVGTEPPVTIDLRLTPPGFFGEKRAKDVGRDGLGGHLECLVRSVVLVLLLDCDTFVRNQEPCWGDTIPLAWRVQIRF